MSNLYNELSNLYDQDVLKSEEKVSVLDWLIKHREDIVNIEIDYLNDISTAQEKVTNLEHRLANCIEPKLIEGHKYFAVCSITKKENCPVCNGNYRKMTTENGFKGELKCSNCDCGEVSKIEWEIIPFTLKYATYDKDGNISYDNEATIDCELDGYQHFSGGLYLDDNSDYRSSWQYKICEEEKCFSTEEEAKAKLEEVKNG